MKRLADMRIVYASNAPPGRERPRIYLFDTSRERVSHWDPESRIAPAYIWWPAGHGAVSFITSVWSHQHDGSWYGWIDFKQDFPDAEDRSWEGILSYAGDLSWIETAPPERFDNLIDFFLEVTSQRLMPGTYTVEMPPAR